MAEKARLQKFGDAIYQSMRETYVDKVSGVVPSRLLEDNTDRSLFAGFFGFRRADYSGSKGKALIAWDILTWFPTVAVNTVALLTEVVPLTFKKFGGNEMILAPSKNQKAGVGYQAFYYIGSVFYYFGRALTSPSKNIRDCFYRWKMMTPAEKGIAVGKAIVSAIYTSVAYAIALPVIAAAIAATPVLTLFGATIIGGGYLLGHAISAISTIPVIGPAIKDVGAAILKGLNSIPGVNNLVTWLMPAKPSIIIVPGHPAESVRLTQEAVSTAKAQVEFVKAATGVGFVGGLVSSLANVGRSVFKKIGNSIKATMNKPKINMPEKANHINKKLASTTPVRIKTRKEKEAETYESHYNSERFFVNAAAFIGNTIKNAIQPSNDKVHTSTSSLQQHSLYNRGSQKGTINAQRRKKSNNNNGCTII